jgi:two-component system cell cycle response regulator
MGSSDQNNGNDSRDDSEKTRVLGTDLSIRKEIEKAKEQKASLILIRGDRPGQKYSLTQDSMVMGRDPAVEISLNDPNISRKHARVFQRDEKVYLADLGSSNGTFINDRRLTPGEEVLLAKEDMIKLGVLIFKYLPAGELETLYMGNLGSAIHTDALTGIYNKGYLLEALDAEFKRAKALHTDFSILFLDLDHFKKINDTHGHDAGDTVLKAFSSLVKNSFVRPKDIFARYGGEEFVILMGNTSQKMGSEIAEKIRCSVEVFNFLYEGTRIPVTSSLGLASMNESTESAQTLLKAADQALYQAKKTGRNRVVVSAT